MEWLLEHAEQEAAPSKHINYPPTTFLLIPDPKQPKSLVSPTPSRKCLALHSPPTRTAFDLKKTFNLSIPSWN
jgi:hypothetical protein